MAPKVLFDLFSPTDDRTQSVALTYQPQPKTTASVEEVVPPPPTAASGVHIPKK